MENCHGTIEALRTDHPSQFGRQDFEGDFALVLEVIGRVDRYHAAFAELTKRADANRSVTRCLS